MHCHRFRCNLTKLTTKSSADWQCHYLLRAAVVRAAYSRGILMWFLASLVGNLAGFLVLLCPVGLPPPPSLFFHCLSVWQVPGHLSRGLMAGLQGLPTMQLQLGPGAVWLASMEALGHPRQPTSILWLVGDCGNLAHNILFHIKHFSTPKWLACVFQHFDNF